MPKPHSMLFLPYTPRPDADALRYDDWLRAVDNPFFNSVPGIAHYSNWKLSAQISGSIPFTHFDFLMLDAPFEAVWGNERLGTFAAGWTPKWGRDPDNADLAVNYHVYVMDHWFGHAPSRCGEMVLGLNPAAEALPAGGELWRVRQSLVGQASISNLGFRYGPVEGDNWAAQLAVATLIAAP
jgi:hypothetical protein